MNTATATIRYPLPPADRLRLEKSSRQWPAHDPCPVVGPARRVAGPMVTQRSRLKVSRPALPFRARTLSGSQLA